MAKIFEKGPVSFGVAKGIMRELKKVGEADKQQRKKDCREILTEIEDDCGPGVAKKPEKFCHNPVEMQHRVKRDLV